MARRRLGVVLLVPGAEAAAVDGLRRALGTDVRRIPAHVTLVPPVNVADADGPRVLALLRAAGAAARPLHLTLGPVATFEPVSPVVFLEVSGDVDGVSALRDQVFVAPLARPLTHPFHPHVTLAEDLPPSRMAAAAASLQGFVADVTVDRLHLLEERRLGDGRRIWRPIADVALGPPAVVGRGGLPLDLAVGERPDPESRAVLATDCSRHPLTVTARRDDAVVGVATGVVAGALGWVDRLVVADGHRRQGIGHHLLARFEATAIERGAETLLMEVPDEGRRPGAGAGQGMGAGRRRHGAGHGRSAAAQAASQLTVVVVEQRISLLLFGPVMVVGSPRPAPDAVQRIPPR